MDTQNNLLNKQNYQNFAQKGKQKLKFILLGILGLIIIVPIVLFIFLGKDDLPPDDRDLMLVKIEVPKEENAFYYLKEVGEKLKIPQEKKELFDDTAKGEKWDIQFVEESINNNQEAFDYFEKAVKLPKFQDPAFANPQVVWAGTPIISLRPTRDIAKLNIIKARYIFNQGKQKEAFDEILKVIEIGQKMENSINGPLIYYLLGMTIKESGFSELRILLPKANLSSDILKDYINKLEKFKQNEEGLANSFKAEYISTVNNLDAFVSEKFDSEEIFESPELPIVVKLNYYYKPNQTKKIFAEYARKAISNANKNCKEANPEEIKILTTPSILKRIFTENLIGKMFHDISAISYSGVFIKKCQEDFSVSGTQTLFALKAYKTDRGVLPETLDSLTINYLHETPLDPFSGVPIRYSSEKKIIYSVGKDFIDSGGSQGIDWKVMDDPTFKIDF